MAERCRNDIASSLAYSFGYNGNGELGLNDTAEHLSPTLLEFSLGKDIVDVACGNQFTAFLTADGEIYTCGSNNYGQCGVETTDSVTTLTLVSLLTEKGIHIERIFSGNTSYHLAAVSTNGELYMAGFNSHGQLGIGTTTKKSKPSVVIDLLGVVDVADVACSYYHSIIKATNGMLYACGQNTYGQLGIPDSVDCHVPKLIPFFNSMRVLSVSCGESHTIVSLESGGLMAFGRNEHGQLGIGRTSDHMPTPTPVVFQPIQTCETSQYQRDSHSESIDSQKRQDEYTGVKKQKKSHNSGLIFFPKVSCGSKHTVVVSDKGTVYAFGHNEYGQLGLGHNKKMLYAGILTAMLFEDVVDVSCGRYHTTLISDEGKLFVFGGNMSGQLGIKGVIDCRNPQPIPSLRGQRVKRIITGGHHSICLVENSTSRRITRNAHGSHALIQDLRHMLNNPNRSDVTFVVEGKKIFAHSFLLSTRCEPMEKMLDGRMCDGSLPEIDIPEYSYTVFLAFMEYLYTSNVELLTSTTKSSGKSKKQPEKLCTNVDDDMEFILELLKLADQYLVSPLKKICENTILRLMSVENVCNILRDAHFRSDFEFKKRCVGFILLHYTDVIATEAFIALPPEVLREVLQIASKRLTVTLT